MGRHRRPPTQGTRSPPQNWWEWKRKISRLRLEMTVVSSALQAPTPPPLPLSGRGETNKFIGSFL